jgi:hypothetical protein
MAFSFTEYTERDKSGYERYKLALLAWQFDVVPVDSSNFSILSSFQPADDVEQAKKQIALRARRVAPAAIAISDYLCQAGLVLVREVFSALRISPILS